MEKLIIQQFGEHIGQKIVDLWIETEITRQKKGWERRNIILNINRIIEVHKCFNPEYISLIPFREYYKFYITQIMPIIRYSKLIGHFPKDNKIPSFDGLGQFYTTIIRRFNWAGVQGDTMARKRKRVRTTVMKSVNKKCPINALLYGVKNLLTYKFWCENSM